MLDFKQWVGYLVQCSQLVQVFARKEGNRFTIRNVENTTGLKIVGLVNNALVTQWQRAVTRGPVLGYKLVSQNRGSAWVRSPTTHTDSTKTVQIYTLYEPTGRQTTDCEVGVILRVRKTTRYCTACCRVIIHCSYKKHSHCDKIKYNIMLHSIMFVPGIPKVLEHIVIEVNNTDYIY